MKQIPRRLKSFVRFSRSLQSHKEGLRAPTACVGEDSSSRGPVVWVHVESFRFAKSPVLGRNPNSQESASPNSALHVVPVTF